MNAAKLIVLAGAALSAAVYLTKQATNGVRLGLAFFRRVEKVIVNVEAQLYPNGGTSLRDAVDKIQCHLGVVNDPPSPREATTTPN